MDILELLAKRRSIRRYQTKPVEKEKIIRVLEAARLGPSAANMQPCYFVVVTEKGVRESLKASYNADWFVQAPVIIVGCANPKEAWRRRDGEEYWKVDLAIAMQNLILAAAELGLGTCWIANFDEKAAKRALNVPKEIRVVAMTPLGYPDEEKGLVTDRKPLDKLIHYERW
ncbi:MAG: nitroreductase family protein [Candidatus Bathyarchaeota archaeon]|nr:nitroreductase family protein [Candidatus Bathyarchaeota archaeon]